MMTALVEAILPPSPTQHIFDIVEARLAEAKLNENWRFDTQD